MNPLIFLFGISALYVAAAIADALKGNYGPALLWVLYGAATATAAVITR